MTLPIPASAPSAASSDTVQWSEGGQAHSARWHSEAGVPLPQRVQVADDTLPADAAYRLVGEGVSLLWRGDFHNARQLLQAIGRRVDRGPKRRKTPAAPAEPADVFHRHRAAQGARARLLGRLLVPLDGDYRILLRRAPDVRVALTEAWGPADGVSALVSLREVLGLIGAHEWRAKGVEVAAVGGRIHPYYGVFSPVRGEYLDLLARAPLPAGAAALAFDIGTGTGVIAALLALHGVARVVATDLDPRALACARDNLDRLGVAQRVELLQADLFPPGRAALVVCNPPWLPARPAAPIEYAIYDEGSRMLRGFLAGLAGHLAPGGEGWLILSDLAEHLGLRSRAELLAWIDAAGLVVRGRDDVRPRHGKASDAADPLHAARAQEVTSLWRLGARG